jgi:hypothetical protein
VRLSPHGTAATVVLLYQPQMIDDYVCGATGGMEIGRGSRNTRRKPSPMPRCPPQIPYNLTRVRMWVAAVGSQRLTAWAITRPSGCIDPYILDLGRIWRWVVSFTTRFLYPRGNSPQYSLIFSTLIYSFWFFKKSNCGGSYQRPCLLILGYWPHVRPLPLPSVNLHFIIWNLPTVRPCSYIK